MSISRRIVILIVITMIFGSINTMCKSEFLSVALKIENYQRVAIGDQGFYGTFFHPFVQTILLFIGQAAVYYAPGQKKK